MRVPDATTSWSTMSHTELAERFERSAAWLLRGEEYDGPHVGAGAFLEAAKRLKQESLGSRGALDVLAERRRHVEVEGWTAEHDDQHPVGDFERAAATYALHHLGVSGKAEVPGLDATRLWPWGWEWLKPRRLRDNLVRAAALLIAAIDKYDREFDARTRWHEQQRAGKKG